MKLQSVEIENYRAIKALMLQLDPNLTVLHGPNASGKTSVLSAIAMGLGAIPSLLPGISGPSFQKPDQRQGEPLPRIALKTTDGISWERGRPAEDRTADPPPRKETDGLRDLRAALAGLVNPQQADRPLDLPIFSYYDTDPIT